MSCFSLLLASVTGISANNSAPILFYLSAQ
jgi:hypothetical protein